jgi:hypothetical protein
MLAEFSTGDGQDESAGYEDNAVRAQIAAALRTIRKILK